MLLNKKKQTFFPLNIDDFCCSNYEGFHWLLWLLLYNSLYNASLNKSRAWHVDSATIGLMCRMFANVPEDWDSIPGHVIPKTQKMLLDGGGQYCSSKSMAWLVLFELCSIETMVKRWYADFKCSHTDINDAKCSGCPISAVVLENTKKLYKLILTDCKLRLHEIAEELEISEGSVFPILDEHLSMRKLCSKWVQHLFTVNQK